MRLKIQRKFVRGTDIGVPTNTDTAGFGLLKWFNRSWALKNNCVSPKILFTTGISADTQSQINKCTLGQPHSTPVQSVPEPSPGKNK